MSWFNFLDFRSARSLSQSAANLKQDLSYVHPTWHHNLSNKSTFRWLWVIKRRIWIKSLSIADKSLRSKKKEIPQRIVGRQYEAWYSHINDWMFLLYSFKQKTLKACFPRSVPVPTANQQLSRVQESLPPRRSSKFDWRGRTWQQPMNTLHDFRIWLVRRRDSCLILQKVQSSEWKTELSAFQVTASFWAFPRVQVKVFHQLATPFYSEWAVRRTWSKIRKGSAHAEFGRPRLSEEAKSNPIKSVASMDCLEWIKQWGQLAGEVDASPKDYDLVLDPFDKTEVYEDYRHRFQFTHLASSNTHPCSYRQFKRIMKHWMNTERVRVRAKKNITTKCDSECWNPLFLFFYFFFNFVGILWFTQLLEQNLLCNYLNVM